MSDKEEKSGALPGAQEKYLAILTDNGRYVVNDNVNLDPIPSRPVDVRDQAALEAALKAPAVSGPPSIIDRLIEGRKNKYETESYKRQHAIDSGNTNVILSGLPVTEEMRSLQQRFVRGELTLDQVIAESLKYHHATVEANRKHAPFNKGKLFSAEDICKCLDISPAEFESAAYKAEIYVVCGEDNVLRYPSASANKIALSVAKNKTQL